MFYLNDADFLQLWTVLRKNKFRFAVLFGSFMWGMPTFVFSQIFNTILWKDDLFTLRHTIIGVIIFLVVGYLWGLWLYNSNEEKFKKLSAQQS